MGAEMASADYQMSIKTTVIRTSVATTLPVSSYHLTEVAKW